MRVLIATVAMVIQLLAGTALASAQGMASSQGGDPRLLARLNDEQRHVYAQWREARQAFERQDEGYWSAISARRSERRRKISAGTAPTSADFVLQMPPKYAGPALRADIAKIQAELAPPPSPDSEITTLPEMLGAAHQLYRFQPSIIPEREFKRRYAVEALAAGLTKEEVTRIYAFETGGRGTFDMQAGINPDTKQGRPISTAMGYAQLLAANSIDELVRSGDGFIARLSMIAANPATPSERARETTTKIAAVREMLKVARSVPKEWARHLELARTPHGFGIHVLNLDGDIGPWLQVIKLKGIKNTAESAGRPSASPAELEIMNLSGPRTGLEMMEPVGRLAPSANFFTKAAYFRNSIVREKTAAELLAAIDHRMNENMTRPGSIEFATVFDEVVGRPQQAKFENRQQLLPATPPQAAFPAPSQPRPVPAHAVAAPQPITRSSQPAYAPSAYAAPSYPPSQAQSSGQAQSSAQSSGQAHGLPVPSAPMRSARPVPQPDTPSPRFDWAPAGLRPTGFPD